MKRAKKKFLSKEIINNEQHLLSLTFKYTKTLFAFVIALLISYSAIAQVGIGNTNPNATLDITASNQATPSNTDGILIPRINAFPITPPTATQQGMMVYLTTTFGGNPPGFYYWDNTTTIWIAIGGGIDHDFYEVGTTTAPNSINDNMFTQGNVAIGKITAIYPLDVETTTTTRGLSTLISGNTTGSIYGNYIENSNTESGEHFGSSNWLTGTGIGNQYGAFQSISNSGDGIHFGSYNLLSSTGTGIQYGTFQSISNSGDGTHYGSASQLTGTGTGDQYGTHQSISNSGDGIHFGSYNRLNGTGTGDQFGAFQDITNTGNSAHYGSFNSLSGTGSGIKYGSYNIIPNSAGGTHYGIYSTVLKANSYAAYFLGNVSVGTTVANNYILPSTRGTNTQIMQTDGSGNVSWVDTSAFGIEKIDDLSDGKSDNDGTQDGSSIFLGINAGTNDDSSDNKNTAIGYFAMDINTTGQENTAIGHRAFESNTGADSNTAVGFNALRGVNATGSSGNTAIGHKAMGGFFTTNQTQVAESNTAIGASTLERNQTGDFNIAIGRNALSSLQQGRRSVAIGYNSLSSYNSFNPSVAIGYNTMANYTGNSFVTAIGTQALENATDCSDCTAIGYNTLRANTTGIENLALGHRSLESNTTGSRNVSLGSYALNANTIGSNNVAIGNFAGAYQTGSNKLIIDSYPNFTVAQANLNQSLIYGEFDTNIIRINGEFQIRNPAGTGYAFPLTDGSANQVMQTNGVGQVSFVNANTIGTDDQNINGSGLSGTNLTIGIENGTSQVVNLASLQDADWYETGGTPPNGIGDNIYTNGNVGINELLPNDMLDIYGNSNNVNSHIQITESQANDGARLRFANGIETTNQWLLYGRADNTLAESRFNINHTITGNIIHIRGDGRVGINDSNPTYALELPNNATITIGLARATAWVTYSDARIKQQQQTIKYGLDDLLKIQPKSYMQFASEFKNDKLVLISNSGKKEIGFIAQELYKIIPEATYKPKNENETLWSINYEKIIPITVQAIKELNTKINTLKNENKTLKKLLSKYEDLEARLTALENKKLTNTQDLTLHIQPN